MNVAVKHNGTTITGFVVRYEREHRICTGIGTLDIVLDGTIPRTFDPWDTIDIYENGDFKVRYYVSEIRSSVPEGTITLECQDKSKQLVDYFIPDSYTIDYPSHTRYWIEKFLDEAGISYQFESASQGPLLSNYTALGLAPAYDQIMMLMQLSGWYFYFDGNGVAIIGPLSTDFGSVDGTLGKDDILNIARVTDDKMLRNRAVVWGAYDPIQNQYAFADVSTHTPYNYDRRDLRAMVISNQNIPNKSSATGIANVLLKEFAKATIEKHLTAWGARNFDLGDSVRVNSHVWRGVGLVTTFGVSMGREGLVTNVILDERCPRLLGFFNFGDYVYVGTFGDGVWRKHIRFDPSWYNFSTGLTDLNITDLHINNGIFGAIGHSGGMFYNSANDGSWNFVTITGLESSQEDTVASGELITYVGFSGIMGRATIIDREINTVKFGVDTWSGLNYGDYFLNYSGMVATSGVASSGVSISGGHRGWIVEYDPFTGVPVGGLGSGIYPISVSGNYNVLVVDLENDGLNDYVSVRTVGGGLPSTDGLYNFGHHYTQPYARTSDPNAYSIQGIDYTYQTVNPLASAGGTTGIRSESALIAIDNQISDYRKTITIDKFFGRATKTTFTKVFNVGANSWDINSTTLDSPNLGTFTTANVRILGIYPDWLADLFTVFYIEENILTASVYKYVIWNAAANTWSAATTIGTQNILTSPSIRSTQFDSVVIGDVIYDGRMQVRAPNKTAGLFKSPCYLDFYLFKIPMSTRVLFQDYMLNIETADDDNDSNYGYFPASSHLNDEGGGVLTGLTRQSFGLFQNDNHVQLLGWTEQYEIGTPNRSQELLFAGDENGIQINPIWDDPNYRFGAGARNDGCQLTKNTGFIGRSGSGGDDSFAFNGTNFSHITGSTPFYFTVSNIYPIYSDQQDLYIAKNGSTFYKCSSALGGATEVITPPSGRTINKPFSNATGPFGSKIWWRGARSFPLTGSVLIPYDFTSFYTSEEIQPASFPSSTEKGINFGNFFISEPTNYTDAAPQVDIRYIDLGEPDWEAGRYLVLQREGSDFHIVQEAAKPIRIDISNNSPVLSVQDYENTFVSNFVYGQEVVQIIPISGLQATREVRDYRYTLLETTTSGTIVASGSPITKQAIYVNQSGVFTADLDTYSGGFASMGAAPSGERIEISNYTYPGQFIFITTSGLNPMFFQRDPGALVFDTYSGLPDSRATIIRLDDRI